LPRRELIPSCRKRGPKALMTREKKKKWVNVFGDPWKRGKRRRVEVTEGPRNKGEKKRPWGKKKEKDVRGGKRNLSVPEEKKIAALDLREKVGPSGKRIRGNGALL